MTSSIDPRVFALSGLSPVEFWSDHTLLMEVGFIALLIFLVLIVLGRLSYVYFFTRKKSYQEEALEKLELFAHISCTTKEEYKRLYYDLTALIKWYVERTLKVNVISLTDDEAIFCIEKKLKDDEVMQNIKLIFQNALGIKYAQHHILQEQVQLDIQKAKASVKKITPEIKEKK